MAAGAAELDGATRRPRGVASGLGRRRTGPAAGPDDRLAHLAYRLSPARGRYPQVVGDDRPSEWPHTPQPLRRRVGRQRIHGGITLRDLAAQWRELQTGLAVLERSSSFPWGPNTGHTVAHTALWVNIELTKNIAEIGQLRLIRAARG